MSPGTDLLTLVLFCAAMAVMARIVWARRGDGAARPTGSAARARAVRASAPVDNPVFQQRMMQFARATAAHCSRGNRHPFEYVTPARTRFRFTLQRYGATDWRIYIDSQPAYRGRSEGGHETHRYVDEAGRHYICWDGPIRGAEQAIFLAARWALMTERYIATGQGF
jgi:hypothetical protein